MEIKQQIETILLRFMSNEISKEELYKWTLDILHKILRGDILCIKYLEIYGIITELAEINDIEDNECKKIAHQIMEVLLGHKSVSYYFAMQIPKKFVGNYLLDIQRILSKYNLKQNLSMKEIQEFELLTRRDVRTINTLNEFFEYQIIDLLLLGFELGDDDYIQFCLKSAVYISEDISLTLENSIMNKINALLQCHNGERCFFVSVLFNNGTSNISIQV